MLSKFRLNGRVWIIQYEGLRQICFKCGYLGHKDDQCPKFKNPNIEGSNGNASTKDQEQISKNTDPPKKPGEHDQFGAWMLVQRTPRRVTTRPRSKNSKQVETGAGVKQGQGKHDVVQGGDNHRTPKVEKHSIQSNPSQVASRVTILENSAEGDNLIRQDMEI